ncbi:MAG: PEP-CTERM sorting domain-containing protein [Pseudomonadota bacterium]|nr:PEP-CTERM sorting domain-containing protein [Pseudomonadota bacterium]
MASLRVLALIPLMIVCGVANATLITFDAHDYAAGTNISTLSPGLHVRTIAAAATDSGPVQISSYEVQSLHSSSGFIAPGYFGGIGSPFGGALTTLSDGYACYAQSQSGSPLSSFCNEGFSFLELNFDVATDFIEIVGGFGDSLGGSFMAFNAAGDLVGCHAGSPIAGVCTPYSVRGEGQYASSLTFQESVITRVVYGAALPAGSIAAGSLSYNHNIPEPATMLLMLTGLSGMFVARRRRQGRVAAANESALLS